MSIECYYGDCKFHSNNTGYIDDGPYCHEAHCKASDKELVEFEKKRREDLKRHAQALQRLASW